jgi:AraC-like DNA-binding protein
MSTSEAPYIPAIHALHLVEVCGRYGVTPSQLLGPMGLSEAELSEPGERVALPVLEKLVARARVLTGEPALGILLGMQMRISAHGYLGFAVMVASNIGEAIELGVRYAPTRTNALALSLSVDGDEAALAIEPLVPLGGVEDVVLFALMEGIRQIGQALTGLPLTGLATAGRAEVTFAEPPYFERFARLGGAPTVRFGCKENRLVFPKATLALPLMMADPAALRLAREQCERALAEIQERSRTTARVRSLLARRGGLSRTLEDVARSLHVSSRTLKRRLAEEGTTFKELADHARREEALRLVAGTDLALEAVAERLGYSDLANFSRAFRRWAGATPGAHRRAARRAAEG